MKRTRLFIAGCIAIAFASSHANAQKTAVVVEKTKFKKDTSSIVKYGAVADGLTLNTNSINKAITAVSQKGGGVVKVPSGLWLTGPIELKSNVNLYLQTGAVLQFTDDFNQYPLVETNWEGVKAIRNQSPIFANGAENIGITGQGIIDGSGDAWRMVKKDKLTETQWKNKLASGGVLSDDKKTWYPTQASFAGTKVQKPGVVAAGATLESAAAYKDFLRPNLMVLVKCRRILLEGVTFQNSPAWCLHPLMSDHITISNLQVKNPWYAQNGDGLDLESCSNVLIENSTFDVGDDGICIKSGRDEEGRKRGMPTQNVTVKNCTVYHAHGGFVIGSEMSGGARNITVTNCTFIGTDIGLRFKTTRGRGGIVENINISDIYMKDIPGEAILFDMYYAAKDPVPLAGEKREPPKVETLPVDETTPQFRNFRISNVYCSGAEKAIFIRGVPEMNVQNILLQNMVLQADKGIDCQEATGIMFKNITLKVKESKPVVYVLNSKQLKFDGLKYNAGADLLMQVQGERSNDIIVDRTEKDKAKQTLETGFGASEKAVTIK